MTSTTAHDQFLSLLATAVRDGTLVKLTFGAPDGADGAAARTVFVRPVALREGPHLSFVYRHDTREETKNLAPEDGMRTAGELLAAFRDAHLYTTALSAELRRRAGGRARLRTGAPAHEHPPSLEHDRAKRQWVDPAAPWLRALGVTDARGTVRREMAGKFRQISRYVEIVDHLLADLPGGPRPLRVVDMGAGKGYLTFALYDHLKSSGWGGGEVRGVEARPDLAHAANRAARENGLDGLSFEAGTIESAPIEKVDVLIALHACDTATDDALARGVQAGAALILAAPCCHKELRPRLRPPVVLAPALRHGILLERHAEFVTDALRAGLLEWAGYDARVFEFVATEHTPKNLMIAAVRRAGEGDRAVRASEVRSLASFYGIRAQRLAGRLGLELTPCT